MTPTHARGRFALLAAAALLACRADDDQTIEGTGTIEHVEIDVAPLVNARVLRLLVDEGDSVTAGQPVAFLINPFTQPEVAAREAGVQRAEEQLRDLQAGSRAAEIRQAEAELAAARSDAARLRRDAERAEALNATGAIPRSEYDAATSRARVAVSRVEGLSAAVRLLREGSRPGRVRTARAEVGVARAGLDAARATLGELTLAAPTDGRVALRVVDAGEIVPAGAPVFTIARTDSLWVRIYLNQRDFARVQVGDSAVATLDPFPNRRFRGHVVALATRAEFTPRVALTEREREDLLFGVKVELQDRSGMLKAGLPVTVRLYPRR